MRAHGFAFMLSSSNDMFNDLPGWCLGLISEQNRFFAVEFDTILNHEFRDMNDNHVGIDIGDLESKYSFTGGYYTFDGLFKDLTLSSGKPIQAWVDYDSKAGQINVTIATHHVAKLQNHCYQQLLISHLYRIIFIHQILGFHQL